MKKIYLILMVFLSLNIFIVSDVYADDLVSIENLNCSSIYDGNTINIIESSVNGMTVDIHNIYLTLNDYYECTFNIKNNSQNEIKISKVDIDNTDYLNINTEYDKDISLKQNETTEFKLKVSYINETEDVSLDNAIKITIGASNVMNPKTGLLNIIPIVLSIILIGIFIITLTNKKYKRFKSLVLILVVVLNCYTSAMALNNNVITINSNINLQSKSMSVASLITYDNTNTGIDCDNVQCALDYIKEIKK